MASKYAVSGMTKNAAIKYVKFGVLTNAIAPSIILTHMLSDAFKEVNPQNPKAAELVEYAQRNPARALGDPKDIVYLVVFLLSNKKGYINGQTYCC